jgi:hypothetical protein
MAASAGTVTLNLDANSVKLLRELQKAQTNSRRTANTMAADFQRAFSRIAKASAVAATAIAGSAVAIYRSQSGVLDSLGKTSDAMGIQQERLQALRHVANLAGTSSEQLSTNLERMQRRIGEIARRGGPAEKTLKEIGVNIQDIVNLSADKQMEVLSKAIVGVENAAVRASIATDLFGRDGTRMLTVMQSLSRDGLDPAIQRINDLGIALSRIDTARIERANDAMTEARQVFSGIFQRLAVNMSDFVYYFATAFTDMAANSDMLGDHIDRMFDRVIIGSINAYEVIAGALEPIITLVRTLWDGFRSLPPWVQEFGVVFAIIGGKKGLAAVAALSAATAGIQRMLDAFSVDLPDMPEWMKGISEFSVIDTTAGLFNPTFESRVSGQVSWLREQLNNVIKDREQFKQNFEAQATGMPITIFDEESFEEAGQQLNQFQRLAESAAKRIQGHFADFFFDPFKDGLKGMARGFIDTIRRMIAEMMAFQAIKMLAGLSGPIGSFFSMAMPSRDSGGRGAAGQPYMIGRGAQPEIFIPDSAGTFIPNADQMGGTTLNITVDARDEGAEARIRDMINREMAPQIIAAAKGSTVAALRRPRFA